MTGSVPTLSTTSLPVPLPRRALDPTDRIRGWYENELGWTTVPGAPGTPLRLATGLRFDVLDVPAEAGVAALRRLGPGAPVAVRADRMQLLVAAGGAEEVPGLLDWLEWGGLPLDLVPIGAGGAMEAPLEVPLGAPLPGGSLDAPPGGWSQDVPPDVPLVVPSPPGTPPPPRRRAGTAAGAALWLRPPVPGREAEASLPTLSALGGGGGAPDLVRVVNTVATQCHRIRLQRACAQPLAFS
ncbi:SCO3374 family protein [Streptomyces sp. NPDC048751]|uniref:SCO3374 family protein n=1 Tax=Streptomyces sp. NPDC048751 TaxID=3365591 RepID=UPI0037130B34